MEKAVETNELSHYHFEAAIAAEYIQSTSYEATNWDKVLQLHCRLYEIDESPYILFHMAVIHPQKKITRLLNNSSPILTLMN